MRPEVKSLLSDVLTLSVCIAGVGLDVARCDIMLSATCCPICCTMVLICSASLPSLRGGHGTDVSVHCGEFKSSKG